MGVTLEGVTPESVTLGAPQKLYLLELLMVMVKKKLKFIMSNYRIRGEWFQDDEHGNIERYAVEMSDEKYRNAGYVS